ncbi:MAG: restriction endonuclease [Polyangiaceae bacterium]
MSTKKTKGPTFLRFVAPIVETLRELGNSGTPSEVTDRVLERLKVSEHEQEETTANGQSRVRNQIAWGRFYLAKAGYLDSSQRGVWSLTDTGRTAKLDPESVHAMFKAVAKTFPRKEAAPDGSTNAASEDDEQDEEAAEETKDYKARLLEILRALPPSGFERICQRLLRESGFQQVIVTGASGDGGIDGHGVLEVNPLVTFKVLFQCKRYSDRPVTPSQVRDFRGAMQGRADKGLILTTGSFTSDARKEATRDGVPPIELVDADKLIGMFERAGLGLRAVKSFEVHEAFFDEFRK